LQLHPFVRMIQIHQQPLKRSTMKQQILFNDSALSNELNMQWNEIKKYITTTTYTLTPEKIWDNFKKSLPKPLKLVKEISQNTVTQLQKDSHSKLHKMCILEKNFTFSGSKELWSLIPEDNHTTPIHGKVVNNVLILQTECICRTNHSEEVPIDIKNILDKQMHSRLDCINNYIMAQREQISTFINEKELEFHLLLSELPKNKKHKQQIGEPHYLNNNMSNHIANKNLSKKIQQNIEYAQSA
jgi:hypothetical protein